MYRFRFEPTSKERELALVYLVKYQLAMLQTMAWQQNTPVARAASSAQGKSR